jgi:hypothetical protein
MILCEIRKKPPKLKCGGLVGFLPFSAKKVDK